MSTKKESPLLAGDMGFTETQNHFTTVDYPKKEYGRKKFAPYSMPLKHLLATGRRPVQDIFLFVGEYAWRKASSFSQYQYTLMLPEGHLPEEYHWPVQQCTVLCVETSKQDVALLKDLCDTLLAYGALGVCLIRHDYKTHFFGGFYGKQ